MPGPSGSRPAWSTRPKRTRRAASCTRWRRWSAVGAGSMRPTRATAACAWSAAQEAIERLARRAPGPRSRTSSPAVDRAGSRRTSGSSTRSRRAVADGLPIAWDVHTRLFGITNLSSALRRAPGRHRRSASTASNGLGLQAGRLGPDVRARSGHGVRGSGGSERGRCSGGAGHRAAGRACRGAAGGGPRGRPPSPDGHRLHLHRGRHRGRRADQPVRGRLRRDDDEPRRAPARSHVAAGVRLGRLVPAAHRGRARDLPLPEAVGRITSLRRRRRAWAIRAGSRSARRRTSSSSTSRRCASRTPCGRRPWRRASHSWW